MSGMGDIQPSGDLAWIPQPAIWAHVVAGDNLTIFTLPDFLMMRIDYAAITIQYRWEDQMTECELQYGGAGSDRGVILAVGALSSPAFTEFVYQQRYYVATETPIYLAHGDAAYTLTLNSASVFLGGISICQAFVSYSLAVGPPGTL